MTGLIALLLLGIVGFEIVAVMLLAFMRSHQVKEEVELPEHEGVPAAQLGDVVGVDESDARMFVIHVGGHDGECENWFLTMQPGTNASEVLAPYPTVVERGWAYLEEICEESPARIFVSADMSEALDSSQTSVESIEFSISGPSPTDSFATSESVIVEFIAQEFASISNSSKTKDDIYREVSRRAMTMIGLPIIVNEIVLSESSI